MTATAGAAHISADGLYRYTLTRAGSNPAVFLMLNPSTADAEKDDPTIRRCLGFSRLWGKDGIVVVNLYALRATDPRELRRHADPIGPLNDEAIYIAACTNHEIVCAWGAGAEEARVNAIRLMLAAARCRALCVGVTKHGHPRHPLYAPYGPAVPLAARIRSEIDR